jgi:hypothetical protein
MPHSFLAYIDESGDDGLARFRQPGGIGGASCWLIISACVFRAVHDLSAVAWRDEILRVTQRPGRNLHFCKLNHGQKLATVRCLAKRPIRAISVLAEKTVIPHGIYTSPNQLYFYMTRYLMERISWVCRDYARPHQGDGRAKIVFSRRGGMSYGDFRAYLLRLQQGHTEIHWPSIDIDGIEARDHSTLAGLQLADAVASAFAGGVESDMYGGTEPRYAEELRPVTYRRNRNFLSYGVKIVPDVDRLNLTADQVRFVNLFR